MMIATYTYAQEPEADCRPADISPGYDLEVLNNRQRFWMLTRAKLHIFLLALKTYGRVKTAVKVCMELYRYKHHNLTLGKTSSKLTRVGNKYYFHLFVPAYPSQVFDEYVKGEFNRIIPVKKKADKLSFLFLAITKKCPLMCEHCIEWDNLNKRESLELKDLKAIVKKFQDDGIAQFHLSGGEPLTRIKDLSELVKTADRSSEFYVLTSGFNFTAENAAILKRAGLTGVVISLDHFDEEKHNVFRGFNNSFAQAKAAIVNAQRQNLVVALTICVTRAFISWDNLLQYAEFARAQNVVFIQILEPQAVGHYKGQDVFLSKNDLELLEKFYRMMNTDPRYKDYPIVVYHGYHQRQMGCSFGGTRGFYIDSEGFVNTCPFCHTKNFNIKDMLEAEYSLDDKVRSLTCPSAC